MNRTKIEWTDFTWNPVTGCKHGCPYCYGREIAKRFKNHFPNGYKPTFHPDRLDEPSRIKKPSKIFTVSMGDLFGDWVPNEWIEAVIDVARKNPKHVFQFLTKNPRRYADFEFPPNCWIGTTVESQNNLDRLEILRRSDNENIKFVSFEPLLGPVDSDLDGIDWIIIGAQTGRKHIIPDHEWVESLISEARRSRCAIFLKDNLGWNEKVQEFPWNLKEDSG